MRRRTGGREKRCGEEMSKGMSKMMMYLESQVFGSGPLIMRRSSFEITR